ncbi:hypothetical protein HYPSUDRAFT_223728 [Hypholoma sublateritium FD-334 SS-4]|uniref:EVE domain-containing protein n=1 Tax=Hypholoma sublateritium (strain FD-334 SS-4) TaxID=945553 RepID=A0A0D2PFS4_HYPSF|nr:hypothetical protein HYPSUDRAFT_223728 [Hypholoma sublateritium FD-334 SS-4]
MTLNSAKYWLLKAEPDSRIVKGKEVKFSVDDFESVGTSAWEGVRNYEARNLMKEMKEGDKALFYHSNCKNPGIAAFAKVSKQAYPDYTAWDASHPYFDAKSNAEDPKWFMVDLTFVSSAKNFVPLSLLRTIAGTQLSAIPENIAYLGENGVQAIKGMDLVTRGRLSVQRVQEDAWKAIEQLAEKGGWTDADTKPKKSAKQSSTASGGDANKAMPKVSTKKRAATSSKTEKAREDTHALQANRKVDGETEPKQVKGSAKTTKRKRERDSAEETASLRRSTRTRK